MRIAGFGVLALAMCFCVPQPLLAEYLVTKKGAWPKSWPKELEDLRDQAKSFEGPMLPSLHHAIPFSGQKEFEAAWPWILSVKEAGAPIVLKRGKSFWLDGKVAGVCVHTPPENWKATTGYRSVKDKRNLAYIELIVDGDIVDLNRIRLPKDTPIIDERFDKKKAL